MIYTINGEEVEYVKIDTKKDKIDIKRMKLMKKKIF